MGKTETRRRGQRKRRLHRPPAQKQALTSRKYFMVTKNQGQHFACPELLNTYSRDIGNLGNLQSHKHQLSKAQIYLNQEQMRF